MYCKWVKFSQQPPSNLERKGVWELHVDAFPWPWNVDCIMHVMILMTILKRLSLFVIIPRM